MVSGKKRSDSSLITYHLSLITDHLSPITYHLFHITLFSVGYQFESTEPSVAPLKIENCFQQVRTSKIRP